MVSCLGRIFGSLRSRNHDIGKAVMPSTNQQINQEFGDISKQRASKACNRCRAKKARCSGGYPCTKCKASDGVCIFGYPKKSKRKTFPEHYVRALEMQQFKLVAGLQTMYTMLLAADSWPGSRMAEQKGNPLVHDILDRLGLLDHDETRDMKMELDMDKYDSDHEPSSDEASTFDSSQESQRGTESSPKSHPQELSASPPPLDPQQQFFLKAGNPDPELDLWNLQPRRSHLNHFSSLPIQLQTEFMLESPPSVTPLFPGTSSTAQSVEATDWTAVDYPAICWQGASQTLQARPFPSNSPMPALPAPPMAAGNPMNIASYYPRSFLVDPGVYASDFDL